jgi:hypothetical protein
MGCFPVEPEHFHLGCSDDLKSADCGSFWFLASSRFDSVTGFFKPAVSPKMGCIPRYPKITKLIYYINRDEIVKNFTNFACGVAARALKFLRSSNRRVFASGFA